MTTQHDLDDMFPAVIDDRVEHELRQLFAAARAPAATDELAGEASVVAAMSDIVRRQSAIGQVTRRRAPLRRVVASRTAKVAMITGFAVVSTSAAVAAGVLPQPMQSVFDRAARIASWQYVDRDKPDDPEPTTITEPAEVPDAVVRTTESASVVGDRATDAQALCGSWAASVRSGVELEPDAKRALIAMAARAGAAIERLCGPFGPTPHEALPTAQESPPPGAVLPPTVSTVDATPVPAAEAPPASTDDATPKSTPTLPPQANGNGPPVRDPSPADEGNNASNNATPNANANANANANGTANAHGGNPNAVANAGGADANGNGNGNGAGANGNAKGGNENSNGGNGKG